MEVVEEEIHFELRARAEKRVGSVLNKKWRLDRLLGVGGMASVYAATHVRNEHAVAVKMLHPELSTLESVRARFAREARVANRIKHKGVVAVVDDDVGEDNSLFLLMELLEGETLEHLVRRHHGVFPADEALSLADQVLDILAAAHAIGITHRDIKPQNVFLTAGGTVKLLDFGIAHVTAGSGTMTGTGSMMGTPGFMPPEQARGRWEMVDARSDVWSVGATLFKMLSAVSHAAPGVQSTSHVSIARIVVIGGAILRVVALLGVVSFRRAPEEAAKSAASHAPSVSVTSTTAAASEPGARAPGAASPPPPAVPGAGAPQSNNAAEGAPVSTSPGAPGQTTGGILPGSQRSPTTSREDIYEEEDDPYK